MMIILVSDIILLGFFILNTNWNVSLLIPYFRYVDKALELTEVGPRFQLKLYHIKLGTVDETKAADTEWVHRPYMNTAAKRRFLSDDDGWKQDDEV